MLSYVDIEAFTTYNYRVTTKAGSSSQDKTSANLTDTQITIRHKQIAKRMLAASKQTTSKQPS
ncbi:hypothetical protein [uncultured Thiothrix sp.]|jgi:hypothetical protein|uniref:hypothetical protein n=1 Tax=uncultured Thiothrix sp. TaxID=223185 RepID=UPI00260EB1B8|nr:hypothetical protein [uncultured Thiothrix sp.]HMT93814.1 hypothetical protein [Thiolinea sp.]